MCSKTKVGKLDFAFARPLTGKSTPLMSKAKCSSAECFSKSLIGRKIRRSFRSSDEHFGFGPRLLRPAEMPVVQKRPIRAARAHGEADDGARDHALGVGASG